MSENKDNVVEVDFGEPTQKTKTVSISELIITGGSATPLEGEFAFNMDEMQTALTERKARLAALKDKSANKTAAKTVTKKPSFSDLGF